MSILKSFWKFVTFQDIGPYESVYETFNKSLNTEHHKRLGVPYILYVHKEGGDLLALPLGEKPLTKNWEVLDCWYEQENT